MMKSYLEKISLNRFVSISYGLWVILIVTLIPYFSIYYIEEKTKDNIVNDAKVLTNKLAEDSVFALIFNSVENAKNVVESTRAFPHVEEVIIYKKEGDVLVGDSSRSKFSMISKSDNVENKDSKQFFEDDMHLYFMSRVYVKETKQEDSLFSGSESTKKVLQLLGYVQLTISKKQYKNTINTLFTNILLVTLVVTLTVYFIVRYFVRQMTRSITNLSESMISAQNIKDAKYVQPSGPEEVIKITNSYNELIDELKAFTLHLEKMVETRTFDLNQAKQEAEKLNVENRRLIRGMNEKLENERKYISNELHDELNSSLIAVKLKYTQIKMTLGESREAELIRKFADEGMKMVDSAISRGRSIIHALRPEIIESLGLEDAIREEVINKYTITDEKLNYELAVDNLPPNIPEDINLSVFRIVQESVNNAIKHADASNIKIAIYGKVLNDKQHIVAAITDNGKGIGDETLDGKTGGIGLLSMRERALSHHGLLETLPAQPNGTHVRLSIPI